MMITQTSNLKYQNYTSKLKTIGEALKFYI